MNHTITHIHQSYCDTVEEIDKNLFKELCFDFNEASYRYDIRRRRV